MSQPPASKRPRVEGLATTAPGDKHEVPRQSACAVCLQPGSRCRRLMGALAHDRNAFRTRTRRTARGCADNSSGRDDKLLTPTNGGGGSHCRRCVFPFVTPSCSPRLDRQPLLAPSLQPTRGQFSGLHIGSFRMPFPLHTHGNFTLLQAAHAETALAPKPVLDREAAREALSKGGPARPVPRAPLARPLNHTHTRARARARTRTYAPTHTHHQHLHHHYHHPMRGVAGL